MALPYSNIDAITDAGYLPEIKNSWWEETVVLDELHSDGPKMQGGERIKQSLTYRYDRGGWYNEYGQFDISGHEFVTAAFLNWKTLEVPMVMSRLDQLRNRGDAAIHDLMEAITVAAKQRIAELMSSAIFSINNDSSTAINGLDHAIDNAAATLSSNTTYAGIDKSTDAFWAGNLYDLGGSGFGPIYTAVNRMLAKAHIGNNLPNLVCMGKESFHSYIGNTAGGSGIQRLVDAKAAERGFMAANVNGIRIVSDSNIAEVLSATFTGNRIYGLNKNHISLVSHEDENMRRRPWQEPVDQNVIVSHLFWAGGLMLVPRFHVIGHNFDPDDET